MGASIYNKQKYNEILKSNNNDKNATDVKLAKTLVKNKNMLLGDDLRRNSHVNMGNLRSRLQLGVRRSTMLPSTVVV